MNNIDTQDTIPHFRVNFKESNLATLEETCKTTGPNTRYKRVYEWSEVVLHLKKQSWGKRD